MFNNILVPLDGSKLAEAVLPSATALAVPSGRLVLMRVTPDLWIDDALTPEQLEEFSAKVSHDCQKYLDGIASGLRKDGFCIDVLVASGVPADQILEVAALAHSDLIAMSTHGHSGLQRLMLGSVADKVVQCADIPVLLVRPPESTLEPRRLDIAVPLSITPATATQHSPFADLQDPFDSKLAPWQVKDEAMPASDEPLRLRHLLRYAILAPSTFNTQPWKFGVGVNEIRVYADHARRLKVVDADERELYVSVGCALENLLIAAEHYGYAHEVNLLPDAANRDLVAVVRLSAGGVPAPYREGLFDCITARFTDHSLYDESLADPDLLLHLQRVCAEPNLKAMFIADEATRQQINQLVARADAVQFADPAFREELGQNMGYGAFGTSWFMSKLQQMAVTTLNLGERTARQDAKALMSAAVFGVITSQEDDRSSQVQAGQLYERMHLLATRLHLGMQPMNQLLQQRYFKSALTDVLFASRVTSTFISAHQPVVASPTPQMAFRLGCGKLEVGHTPSTRHTPRRSLEDVLTS